MTYSHTLRSATVRSHRPVLLDVFALLKVWNQRSRTRRQLSRLGTDRLADVALTAEQAMHEAKKPFWQA